VEERLEAVEVIVVVAGLGVGGGVIVPAVFDLGSAAIFGMGWEEIFVDECLVI
jgi:hypothetical protein